MDFVDYTGVWSCTSRAFVPPPGPTPGGGGRYEADWDAWHREIRRRQLQRERIIQTDDEEFLIIHSS